MDKLYSLVEEHMLTRHEHLYSIPSTQKKKNSHHETEFPGIYALFNICFLWSGEVSSSGLVIFSQNYIPFNY